MGLIFVDLFCAIVAVTMVSILLLAFNPNQNSPGALGSACMDVISIIVLLIMVFTIAYGKDALGRTNKLFLGLMLGTMWGLFFDFLTWSLDGSLVYGGWTFAFTIASLCSGSIMGGIFVMYLSSYMTDMYDLKESEQSAKICCACNIFSFVVTITLAISRSAFVFNDGHYETGVLYDVITVIPILTLIFMAVYCIRRVKVIGTHDVVSVVIYIGTMIVGVVIEAMYGIGTTYVSVMIADVFIFIMLQNKHMDRFRMQKEMLSEKVDEEKRNAEKWMQRSNTDEVTGFYNRHAYEEELGVLERTRIEDNLVYVSMDVNGLKVVNDNLGHEAGDELLVGACECMEKCFGMYGKLYRTGGDEFAALIYATDYEMEILKKEFTEITSQWRSDKIEAITISTGYVTRKEAKELSLHQMAVLADKRMYEDKNDYYQRMGIDRRGQKDAFVALCNLYTKILKINLTDDSYEIEQMDSAEQTKEMGFSSQLSAWMAAFGKAGLVHTDDLKNYLAFTGKEYISEYFKETKKPLRIFYRRKIDGEFRKVMMEIIPTSEYSESSEWLYLYVKDIEDASFRFFS